MSIKIDFSKPLTEFEKFYLRQRNKGHLIPPDSPDPDLVVVDLQAEDDSEDLDPGTPEEVDPEELDDTDSEDDSEDHPRYSREDYESWTRADLMAEIRDRNLERSEEDEIPSDGKKADLVEALVADDES